MAAAGETPPPEGRRTREPSGSSAGGDIGDWMRRLRLFPPAYGWDGSHAGAGGGSLPAAAAAEDGSASPLLVGASSSEASRTPRSSSPLHDEEQPTCEPSEPRRPHDEPLDDATLSSCPRPSDLDPSVWLEATLGRCGALPEVTACDVPSWRAGAATALGLATAAGLTLTPAVLVIHPLVLVGAAVGGTTALWAVGRLGEEEEALEEGEKSEGGGGGYSGYRLFSGEEFGRLFWSDECAGEAAAVCGEGLGPNLSLDEGLVANARTVCGEGLGPNLSLDEGLVANARADAPVPPPPPPPTASPGLKRVRSAPAAVSRAPKNGGRRRRGATLLRRTSKAAAAPSSSIVDRHYPPLELCVASGVRLPGISSEDFFSVFFADDAPYSMKDFQLARGDVDIEYGPWTQVKGTGIRSYKPPGKGFYADLPAGTTRERTLTFSTLTKSYFGPAYARATKVQRTTALSPDVLVIEHATSLDGIPYGDRFRVLERWVVESSPAVDEGGEGDVDGARRRNCRLSIHGEVEMLRPCTFESQIRKRAAETFAGVAEEWCETARVALRATEEQRRRRRSRKDVPESSAVPRRPPPSDLLEQRTRRRRRSELLARHRRRFDEIDAQMAAGDTERHGGIEIVQVTSWSSDSSDGRTSSVRVLESPNEVLTVLASEYREDEAKLLKWRERKALMVRRQSRGLLRRLKSSGAID